MANANIDSKDLEKASPESFFEKMKSLEDENPKAKYILTTLKTETLCLKNALSTKKNRLALLYKLEKKNKIKETPEYIEELKKHIDHEDAFLQILQRSREPSIVSERQNIVSLQCWKNKKAIQIFCSVPFGRQFLSLAFASDLLIS